NHNPDQPKNPTHRLYFGPTINGKDLIRIHRILAYRDIPSDRLMMAGGNSKKKFNKSKIRKPTKPSLFVEGGLLSDYSPVITSPPSRGKSNNSNTTGNKLNASKNKSAVRFEIGSSSGGKSKASGSTSRNAGSQKPTKNAFAYKYPQVSPLVDESGDGHNKFEKSNPIVLLDSKESKIIAYIDETAATGSETVKYTYDYGASFEVDDSCHRGLGFHDVAEESPCGIEASPVIEKKECSGFDSSSSQEMETDMMDDDASDVNDEIAKDYFEGIGGSYKVANVDQLVGQALDSFDGRFNEMLKGIGGIGLQDASREYGMKKPCSRKKSRAKPSKFQAATDDCPVLVDLMLEKNPRYLHGKKKHAAKLPQSWPSKAEKSKNFRRFCGDKKKLRQDRIVSKRRERMIRRGVDLEQINSKLEQMVQNEGDIMSFQLMHSRDCSQVQRLAAIYRLRSVTQGSGRKRFVTVTRTQHTGMPSSSDRLRLEKLLGVDDEANDMTVNKVASNRSKKGTTRANGFMSPLESKSAKTMTPGESSKKKRRDKDKIGSYAAQPVSFISSGNMVSERAETIAVIEEPKSTDQTLSSIKPVVNSSSYGAFEMHTTGFGSRMMAKMGYVDGGGLGKDGRGIAEPIEAIQRPKSLGLGAKIPETSNTSEPMNVNTPPQRPNRAVGQGSRGSESRGKSGNVQFGCFEKHTKGFGSKMMAKMGFVEGMGLGRDSQGVVQPLVASRLPKSRGLGAKV
ncbi:G-patch domain-containing protein, partial [Cynara cardunculus var. scolymus]